MNTKDRISMHAYRTFFGLLSIGLTATGTVLGEPLYRVTDLGRAPGYTYSTVPLGLNNRGEVVGAVQQSLTRAFIWSPAEGIRVLPPVPGNENRSSQAVNINDLGHVIGFSGQSGGSNLVGWVYRNGAYAFLGTLPGYNGSVPAAINNLGEVVGAATGANATDPSTDFYWSDATGIIDPVAGRVELYDINDAGVACGGIRSGTAAGLMLWDLRGGQATDLGMLPDTSLSFAYSINESSGVAGASIYISSSGHRTSHGVWAAPGEPVSDGQLFQSVATGINERGQVVGWRTFQSNSSFYSWLYTPGRGVTSDLHLVIEQPDLYTRVSDARAINDQGQIIATTQLSQGVDPFRRGILLTPMPQPGDMNCDGSLNAFDIQGFTTALEDPNEYQQQYPDCNLLNADTNSDGSVNAFDIQSFVELLGG